jgi:hypothetical protein
MPAAASLKSSDRKLLATPLVLVRKPITPLAGSNCDNNSSLFPVSSPLIRSTPVIFAPGWLRLVTIPSLTESPATNVIGIDRVTDFAARADGAPPAARMMAGFNATNSSANFLS